MKLSGRLSVATVIGGNLSAQGIHFHFIIAALQSSVYLSPFLFVLPPLIDLPRGNTLEMAVPEAHAFNSWACKEIFKHSKEASKFIALPH